MTRNRNSFNLESNAELTSLLYIFNQLRANAEITYEINMVKI